jgi:hypothetical protein
MTDQPTTCPVCDAKFGNEGGCATHMQRTKDAAHTAHRAGASAPASHDAPPASPPSVLRIASPDAAPTDAASRDASDAQGARDAMRGDVALQDAGLPAFFENMGAALPASQPAPEQATLLSLPPPARVEPLIPPDAPTAGGMRTASPVSVPLEPILAGTVAISLNALFLSKPGDGKLTPERVSQTGFPKAMEGSLRLYFPELPLDHPLTALIASSAGLAMAVVELKAKAPSESQAPPQAPPQATVQAPQAMPDAVASAPASTGDAYWDAILRSQGGGIA